MIGAFIGLGVVLVFASMIGLLVLFFWHKDKQLFNFKLFFSAYCYLVAMASLLAMVYGATSLTKAVLSDGFGRQFSYYQYDDRQIAEPAIDTKAIIEPQTKDIAKQEKQRIEAEYQNDVFTGISTLVVGLLFLLVHVFAWWRLEPAAVRSSSILYKGYVLVQLVLYSLITLVALPTAISQALRFWLVKPVVGGTPSMPGEPLAVAIWVTPLWLGLIWLTLKTMRKAS